MKFHKCQQKYVDSANEQKNIARDRPYLSVAADSNKIHLAWKQSLFTQAR